MYVKFIRIIAVVVTGLCFVYGCSSSTWDDAQKADTYQAYQSYIADNPEGKHVEEAKKRADNRYWNSIKDDSTAESFEKYLDEFPNGQSRSKAQRKLNQLSPNKSNATKGRVTGSSIIIRSNHTTESASVGVVAKEGTIVQILDQYNTSNSNEAILKRSLIVVKNGDHINLPAGKAIRILSDRNDSVRASFSTPNYGATEATISKHNIEGMSGQKWYKIHTSDDITGWIYGKFVEEL